MYIGDKHNMPDKMIEFLEDLIAEQERKIASFMEKRNVVLEHIPGTGRTTTLTIDVEETEAVDGLQGMKKVLSRYKETLTEK